MLDQILKNKAGPERAEIMKKACQVRVYERKKFVREKDCREIGFILSPPPTVIPLRDSLNEFLVMDTPHFLSTTVILCCVFYRILTLFWRKHYNYRSRMITSRLVLSDPTVCLLCYILWNVSGNKQFLSQDQAVHLSFVERSNSAFIITQKYRAVLVEVRAFWNILSADFCYYRYEAIFVCGITEPFGARKVVKIMQTAVLKAPPGTIWFNWFCILTWT